MRQNRTAGTADGTQQSPSDPTRRDLIIRGAMAAAGAGIAGLLGNLGHWAFSYAAEAEPVKIGVLHSLSGTMAISEVSLRDVVLMAAEEINAAGGLLGRPVQPVVVDPASDWELFAHKAKQLLVEDKVSVVFGCWTSVSRKAVLPVFEKHNGLLFYPVQYEGEECSRNVFYTGATVNQQAVPAIEYLMSEQGGGRRRFYLLGTDYVYPRKTNKILRAVLMANKVPPADIMEEYTPFHHQDYRAIVGRIRRFAASGDACVISTINGDSNVPFYKEFGQQGLQADDAPIMAFSIAEDELRGIKTYCKTNRLPGGDRRVTDDPIEAAYFGVHVWKQAVERAGSTDVDRVRKAVYGMEFTAPGGRKKMDEGNHHTHKPVLIGEILADGQFKVVWRTKGWIKPEPWSRYTNPDVSCDWQMPPRRPGESLWRVDPSRRAKPSRSTADVEPRT